MASGSSSQQGSSRAPAGTPPAAADAGHLAPAQPSLNPNFEAMSSAELIAHLKRHHRRAADFADAALVLAERERRLAEAERLVRMRDRRIGRLLEGIAARDAQIKQAAVREERLQAEIRALQQARAADDGKARPLQMQQPKAAAANAKQARTRHDDSGPSGQAGRGPRVDDTTPNQGKVGDDLKRPRYKSARMNASPPGFQGRSAQQNKQPRRRS